MITADGAQKTKTRHSQRRSNLPCPSSAGRQRDCGHPWCRVRLLLRSKSWDTRVAAAAAVEAVCRNMDAWEPNVGADRVKGEEEASATLSPGVLDSFDVGTIIAKGQLLVSSSGVEFNDIHMDPLERLALQKQQLRETLGLAPVKGGGEKTKMPTHKGDIFNVQDMIDDKDLVAGSGFNQEAETQRALKRKASDLVESMAPQVKLVAHVRA